MTMPDHIKYGVPTWTRSSPCSSQNH